MVSEKVKTFFGKVKDRLKPEDIAKFAAKEAVDAIPVVGQIIKDAFDELSQDEKEELIKELKELSESQFKEISEKVGVSADYLKDIRALPLNLYCINLPQHHTEPSNTEFLLCPYSNPPLFSFPNHILPNILLLYQLVHNFLQLLCQFH